MKLYLRTPHTGNEYKVCNEETDEVIAIFFNQQDALAFLGIEPLKDKLKELTEALRSCSASLATYGSHPLIEQYVTKALNK